MKEEITKAIAAHGEWKVKFREFMAGKLDLDPNKVRQPNVCEFGHWLETSGHKEMPADSFKEVNALHAKFHEIASEVIKKKKSGDTPGAEKSLGAQGEFSKASAALTSKLMHLTN
jgi:hypothetical protein